MKNSQLTLKPIVIKKNPEVVDPGTKSVFDEMQRLLVRKQEAKEDLARWKKKNNGGKKHGRLSR